MFKQSQVYSDLFMNVKKDPYCNASIITLDKNNTYWRIYPNDQSVPHIYIQKQTLVNKWYQAGSLPPFSLTSLSQSNLKLAAIVFANLNMQITCEGNHELIATPYLADQWECGEKKSLFYSLAWNNKNILTPHRQTKINKSPSSICQCHWSGACKKI